MSSRGPLRIHLAPLDRALLLLLDDDPGMSIVNLAAALDVSPRTVSRALARLVRADVVTVRGRTLPTFEGSVAQLVRAHGRPALLTGLARAVAEDRTSRWVRLSKDRTELMCGFVSPDDAQTESLAGLLDDGRLREVSVASLLHVWGASGAAVTRAPRELDDRDRLILDALALDGRMESSELARRVGLDPSTVSRRRRRLLQDGVLYLEADIHPAALAELGDAMVWMSLLPGHVMDAGRKLRAHREVRFVAATSGTTQLVANVAMPDRDGILAFIDGELAGLGVTSLEIVPMGTVVKRAR